MKFKTALALVFAATAAMAGCSSTSNTKENCTPKSDDVPSVPGCSHVPGMGK